MQNFGGQTRFVMGMCKWQMAFCMRRRLSQIMDNRKMVNRSRRSSNHFVSVFLNSYKQALEIARTVPYTIKLTILSLKYALIRA